MVLSRHAADMLDTIIQNAQETAAQKAQNAAIGFGAGLAIAVGLGFLTVASWLLLVSITTTVIAAVILGGAYMGLGLILLATISIRSRNHRKRKMRAERARVTEHPPADPLAQVILAFVSGLKAGRNTRS